MTERPPIPAAAEPLIGTDIRAVSDAPMRVTIEPVLREEFWFGVLDLFVDHFIPLLSGAEVKVQLLMFRRRDRISGVVGDMPQPRIAAELNLSPASVSSALRTLTSVFDLETRRPLLLEPISRASWLVAPACRFRGTRLQPAERSLQPAERSLQPAEQTFSRLNENPAPHRERARAASQPDSDVARSKPDGNPVIRAGGRLAGWPEPGLFGEEPKADPSELRALLRAAPLHVGGELLARVCSLPDVSIAEINREWAHLAGQISRGLVAPNPGALLCERLLRARGLKMPRGEKPRPMAAAVATAAGELGDLQRVINERRRMLAGSAEMDARLSREGGGR